MLKKIFYKKNSISKKYLDDIDKINTYYDSITNIDDIPLEEIQGDVYKTLGFLKKVFSIKKDIVLHDEQLLGSLAMIDGYLIEMKTGEGKTFSLLLSALFDVLQNKKIAIIVPNQYLITQSINMNLNIFEYLNIKVGEYSDKKKDIEFDLLYALSNEIIFQKLHDEKRMVNQKVKLPYLDKLYIDEADHILIDQAKQNISIHGLGSDESKLFKKLYTLTNNFKENNEYTFEDNYVELTDIGIQFIQNKLKIDNLFDIKNQKIEHVIKQLILAKKLYKKDRDFIIKDEKIHPIDQMTGKAIDSKFSNNIHQCLEVINNLPISRETYAINRTTFQDFFNSYEFSGCSGTILSEELEFLAIYNKKSLKIPTHTAIIRKDYSDMIFLNKNIKFKQIIQLIKNKQKTGQPVLIGTINLSDSEKIYDELQKENIPCSLLSTKNENDSYDILQNAGNKYSITIVTNMAGRGVDIKISDEVKSLGGLFILGTEINECKRLDEQLRGRSGRQGESGESQFYISLEDDFLLLYGGKKIQSLLDKLDIDENEAINSRIVSKQISSVQRDMESMLIEQRKSLIKYNEVEKIQKDIVQNYREKILDLDYDIYTIVKENDDFMVENFLYSLDINTDISYELSEDEIKKVENSLKTLFKVDVKFEDSFKRESTHLKKSIIEMISKVRDFYHGEYDDSQINLIYREIFLNIIDQLWTIHLEKLDNLKQGINFRSFTNKDPLNEFKKDSYNMFEIEFVNHMKIEISKTLLNIRIRKSESS